MIRRGPVGTGRSSGSTLSPPEPDSPRGSPESAGVQMTRVGIWYLAGLAVVAVAATNTGNNGLFLVTAMMASSLIVVQLLAAWNVRGLEVELGSDDEIFVNQPSNVSLTVRNPSRFRPRWLLVVSVELDDSDDAPRPSRQRVTPWLIPFLPPGGEVQGLGELMLRRRGPRKIRSVEVSSLFPLGLYHKGIRHPQEIDILVYPEIFHGSAARARRSGDSGDDTGPRAGWGHDLFALRDYQPGDDPRGIHWKQTARQGQLIFQQRAVDENRRFQIVLDNAVGELHDGAERKRFERLVSEAATAALDFLGRGYEVSLTTRDGHLPFAAGPRQRRNILEVLAWIDTQPEVASPLSPAESRAGHLRLAMEREREAAPGTAEGPRSTTSRSAARRLTLDRAGAGKGERGRGAA
ncbi:MAG: DUF58 domain-containing protein [Holophagales bacterium]|nr:DUF58 domain-containing protein [Holophagales bacterium]